MGLLAQETASRTEDKEASKEESNTQLLNVYSMKEVCSRVGTSAIRGCIRTWVLSQVVLHAKCVSMSE